jgi:hypothetical protein
VWENCGAFPFHTFAHKEDGYEDMLSLVEKTSTLRGNADRYGAVLKGIHQLDWTLFEHQKQTFPIGADDERYVQKRLARKRPLWKFSQAYWLKNHELAYRCIQRMREVRGTDITVEMLVEAMIIPSGNDATYVLAAAAGKRLSPDKTIDGKAAVDVFMIGLRAYAEKIGLCGSQILVPDGYEGDGHYTTVEDMIIVSRLATQNEIIMKYAAMPDASVVYASGHTNTWNNTNKLLDESGAFYSPYVTGLKTGTVDGECSLIFSFEFEDGRKYIAGLFGSPDKNTRFYDALKIIEELK